jgi:hypothetical protein
MEEPRTQDARPQDNRDVPRSRTPRAAFSPPEPAAPTDGPTPKDRPAERAPRRQGGAKAAPAVTFQQPQGEESKSSSGTGSEASVPGKPARVTPSRKGSAKANRAKPDAVKPSTADTARPQVPAARPSDTRKPTDGKPSAPKPSAPKPVPATSPDAGPTAPKPVEAEPTAPKPVEAEPVDATLTATGDSGSAKSDAAAAVAGPETARTPRKAGRRTTTGRGAVPAEEVTPAVIKAAPAKRTPRKATTAAGAAQPGATVPETAVPEPAPTELTPVAATSVPAAATEAQLPAADAPTAVAPAESAASGYVQASGDVQGAAPATVAAVATAAASVARYDWSKVVSDPGHTPELLALAAVETIGPRAAEWVRRTRESYPTATPQGLARLAIAEFTRRGTVGAALGAVAGSYAPMALMGAAVWTQAELVLHVAAAHGHDPADQARAAELLVLAKVHPNREDAEAALAAARQPGAGSVDARLRVGRPLATQVGGWLAIRAVNRFFPGTSVVLATLFSRGAAEMLGVRAIGLYEGKASR